jgi:hypothetical protein
VLEMQHANLYSQFQESKLECDAVKASLSEYVSHVALEKEQALAALREELTDEMDVALQAMQSALRTEAAKSTTRPLAASFFQNLWVSVVTGIRNIDFSDEAVETEPEVLVSPAPVPSDESSVITPTLAHVVLPTPITPNTSAPEADARLLSLQRRLSMATPSDDRCQALTRRLLAKDSLIAALRTELNTVHDQLKTFQGAAVCAMCIRSNFCMQWYASVYRLFACLFLKSEAHRTQTLEIEIPNPSVQSPDLYVSPEVSPIETPADDSGDSKTSPTTQVHRLQDACR